MRVGLETILFGHRIDDLETTLDVVVAAGYQGVEFSQSPRMLRVKSGLWPSSGWVFSHSGMNFSAGDREELVQKVRALDMEAVKAEISRAQQGGAEAGQP